MTGPAVPATVPVPGVTGTVTATPTVMPASSAGRTTARTSRRRLSQVTTAVYDRQAIYSSTV